MRIALIGAMDVEVSFLIDNLANKNKEVANQFIFYTGLIEGKDVVVVKSGVGKTMSGVLIGTLINKYPDISHIINVGIAGGLNHLKIGDIVVGNSYVYGDVDLSSAGDYVFGRMANCPFIFSADKFLLDKCKSLTKHFGTICTTDQFMVDANKINKLIVDHFADLDIYAFDMESTAFAQAAYFFKIPFLAVRAISDIIGSEKEEEKYDLNFELASLNSNKFILELMKKI